MDSVGLGQERLSPNAIGFAQIVAKVADLLGIRDTETNRYGLGLGLRFFLSFLNSSALFNFSLIIVVIIDL